MTHEDPPEDRSSAAAGCFALFIIAAIIGLTIHFGLPGQVAKLADWIVREGRELLEAVGASDIKPKKEGGWLDRIFAADAFVGAVRLALGALGVLVLFSVTWHIVQRRWLTFGGGPIGTVERDQARRVLEGGREVSELVADNERLEAEVTRLQHQIQELESAA